MVVGCRCDTGPCLRQAMTDKPIQVGDRVRPSCWGGLISEVRAVADDRLMVLLPSGGYDVWKITDCTRLPRTRKVERWVYECRLGSHTWTNTASTDEEAISNGYRVSAPVRVELEVEEET